MEAALDNAKAVRERDHPPGADILNCNSSTDVYKLVGRLLYRYFDMQI